MGKEWMLSAPCQLCAGKYGVERVIGETDGGITYQAVLDTKSVCLLAYKPTEGNEATQQEARNRFLEDAEMLRKFSHVNIVEVLDIFEESGVVYVVLPWLEGRTHAAVRKAQIAFGPYQPQVDETKDYLRTLNIEEDKLPTKPYFLFLPDKSVRLVGFGAVRIFDNSLLEAEESVQEEEPQTAPAEGNNPKEMSFQVPQPITAESRPVYHDISACKMSGTRPSEMEESSQKSQSVSPIKNASQPMTVKGRSVRQAVLACNQCHRPLPICRCPNKRNQR